MAWQMQYSRHTPNALTTLRAALLVPFSMMVLGVPRPFYLAALLLWISAAALDIADGHIARSRGTVTEFGAVLDLVVDRVMIVVGVILVATLGAANVYLVLLIVSREILVDSARALRLKDGHLIPHNMFGRAKMAAIVLAVIGALTGLSGLVAQAIARWITDGSLLVALVLGTLSLHRILGFGSRRVTQG